MKQCEICQTKCSEDERYCPNCGHRFENTYYYDDELNDDTSTKTVVQRIPRGIFATILTVGIFILGLMFVVDMFLPSFELGSNDYDSYEELVQKEPSLDIHELDAMLDKMHTIIPKNSEDYWIYESYTSDKETLTSAYISMSKSDARPYDGYYDLNAHCYDEEDWTLTRNYRITFDPIYLEEILQNTVSFFDIQDPIFIESNKETFEARFTKLQNDDKVSFYLSGEGYNLSIEMIKEESYRCTLYIRGMDEIMKYENGSMMG